MDPFDDDMEGECIPGEGDGHRTQDDPDARESFRRKRQRNDGANAAGGLLATGEELAGFALGTPGPFPSERWRFDKDGNDRDEDDECDEAVCAVCAVKAKSPNDPFVLIFDDVVSDTAGHVCSRAMFVHMAAYYTLLVRDKQPWTDASPVTAASLHEHYMTHVSSSKLGAVANLRTTREMLDAFRRTGNPTVNGKPCAPTKDAVAAFSALVRIEMALSQHLTTLYTETGGSGN